jgi:hypothetical protein
MHVANNGCHMHERIRNWRQYLYPSILVGVMTIYYGWYSEQQSQLTGTCIYAECNTGNEIELTEVNCPCGIARQDCWIHKD